MIFLFAHLSVCLFASIFSSSKRSNISAVFIIDAEDKIGVLGAIWGITGVVMILGFAIYRLAGISIDALSYELHWYHWLLMSLNIIFMAHSEGYRGFQQNFAPRVVARAKYLMENPRFLPVLLSPLFCAGYFNIVRKRQILVYGLTIGIFGLVLLVHNLAQPWRGIVDAGVVIGLTWGVLAVLVFSSQAFVSKTFDHDPEIPD